MRTLPIRLRLAVVFAGAAAILLTAVGLFGYVRLSAGFSDDVDRELRQRAQDLVGPVSGPGASLRDLSASPFIERGESFHRAGRRTLTETPPPPCRLAARMLPPWNSAISRAT